MSQESTTPATIEDLGDGAVLFAGEICPLSAARLVSTLRRMVAYGSSRIILRLNSLGGCMHSGFQLYDHIAELQAEEGLSFEAVAEGMVGSAAILPFLACDRRKAQPHAVFLLHEVRSKVCGELTLGRAKDDVAHAQLLMRYLIRILVKKTRMSRKQAVNYTARDSVLGSKLARLLGIINTS